MSRIIHTAIASFGMSGRVFHAPCLKVDSHYLIKKILERSRNLSSKNYPDAEIVRSFDDILADDKIDLVIVNTPDPYHYEMAKAALMANKHVVVEKPFAQTPAEARELIQIAKNKNLVLTVYQNRRWDGDFMTVKELIEKGLVGRLVEYESHYDRYRNFIQQGTWKEEEGGTNGVLYNLGSHMVDQVLLLFGLPKAITAHFQVLRSGGKVPDYYAIRMQYDGFSAILKCTYLAREPGPRYTIHGTLGSYQKYGMDPQESALNEGKLPGGENWGKEPKSQWGLLNTEIDGLPFVGKRRTLPGDYIRFYTKLYDAIVLGQEPPVRPEEALMTLEMLQHCITSDREGRTVFL